MKKVLTFVLAISLICVICISQFTVNAAAPADALYYADFNKGPMAEPESDMQATESGGRLYINNGPINSTASIVDGAMKLELGSSGYYGFNNTQCAFRDVDGNLTDYKYLVLRMKGEYGTENTPGAGDLMMCIGGGDGTHMGTFTSSGNGTVSPFLDPDGCYMPLITKEYQYFVIALSQKNVRVNEGKLVSGINFNSSAVGVTVYIDEIFLTSEIPEGFVSSGKKPKTDSGAGTETVGDNPNALQISTPGSASSGTVAKNVIVPGGAVSSLNIATIIVLMVLVVVNLAVIVLVILKLRAVPKD